MARNNYTRKYVCDHEGCGKGFDRGCDLSRHRNEVHERKTLYFCPMEGCKHKATRKNNLTVHIESTHGRIKRVCPLCGEKLYDEASLRRHAFRKHNVRLTTRRPSISTSSNSSQSSGPRSSISSTPIPTSSLKRPQQSRSIPANAESGSAAWQTAAALQSRMPGYGLGYSMQCSSIARPQSHFQWPGVQAPPSPSFLPHPYPWSVHASLPMPFENDSANQWDHQHVLTHNSLPDPEQPPILPAMSIAPTPDNSAPSQVHREPDYPGMHLQGFETAAGHNANSDIIDYMPADLLFAPAPQPPAPPVQAQPSPGVNSRGFKPATSSSSAGLDHLFTLQFTSTPQPPAQARPLPRVNSRPRHNRLAQNLGYWDAHLHAVNDWPAVTQQPPYSSPQPTSMMSAFPPSVYTPTDPHQPQPQPDNNGNYDELVYDFNVRFDGGESPF